MASLIQRPWTSTEDGPLESKVGPWGPYKSVLTDEISVVFVQILAEAVYAIPSRRSQTCPAVL